MSDITPNGLETTFTREELLKARDEERARWEARKRRRTDPAVPAGEVGGKNGVGGVSL